MCSSMVDAIDLNAERKKRRGTEPQKPHNQSGEIIDFSLEKQKRVGVPTSPPQEPSAVLSDVIARIRARLEEKGPSTPDAIAKKLENERKNQWEAFQIEYESTLLRMSQYHAYADLPSELIKDIKATTDTIEFFYNALFVSPAQKAQLYSQASEFLEELVKLKKEKRQL